MVASSGRLIQPEADVKTQKPILDIPKRDFYPIHEVEQKTSLSRASIYRHARSGKIKLVKVGGRTLVPEAEIARLVSGDAMNATLS